MTKTQSHSTLIVTDSHCHDCQCQSCRESDTESQRDTHSHRHRHGHGTGSQLVACCFETRTTPAATGTSPSITLSGRLAAIWLQLVRQYYTERGSVLDITAFAIARLHDCLHRVPLHNRHNHAKPGQCLSRPRNGILSRDAI